MSNIFFTVGAAGAFIVAAGAAGTAGLPIDALGTAVGFIVAFGIAAIVGFAMVAMGFIVGVGVAAIETTVEAATNDARTSSTTATLEIFIPIPPQYPLR
jgi:Na+/serine symporter